MSKRKLLALLIFNYCCGKGVVSEGSRRPAHVNGRRLSATTLVPPAIVISQISNIASHSMDISWDLSTDPDMAAAITGYQVFYIQATTPTLTQSAMDDETVAGSLLITVGKIITTTVTGLIPNAKYWFWIRGLVEPTSTDQWSTLDMYGRRNLVPGASKGPCSTPVGPETTLQYDINFPKFGAYSLVSTGASDIRSSTGPRGQIGGEGYYGLTLLGSAQVENCNRTASCCDNYVATATPSCLPTAHACSGATTVISAMLKSDQDFKLPTLSTVVGSSTILSAAGLTVQYKCGDSLRLTGGHPRQSGAVWYPRAQQVGEGFDTTFEFRIRSPSVRCWSMDDVHTQCRSRGADGLAFVIQNAGLDGLGAGGGGMGYEGLHNALVVEFDTYYNPELEDPYENHVSVHTRGFRDSVESHHSYSLGSSVEVTDLTEGDHKVRVVYTPIFDPEVIRTGQLITSPYASHFLENADFPNGGQPDWGTGVGLLYVYVDEMIEPRLVLPLNLEATLKLDQGRAWVGFTAATGDETWQSHDLISWVFSATRENIPYTPPPIVNGEGAFECSPGSLDSGVCIHPGIL